MPDLRSDLLNPIPGDNPAGTYLRWDPADKIYNAIKDARFEEEDLPQGDWARERRTADHDGVIRIAGEALATRSKDLQLAAWLTEALLHRQGFSGLASGLDLLGGLLEAFWDHLYPPVDEDGDVELRAAPLVWVGERLGDAVRGVPLNNRGHDFVRYKTARVVGYEKEVEDDDGRRSSREQAIRDGKLTPEEFDAGFAATPKPWYKELVADLEGAAASVDKLEALCDGKFGADAPSFRVLRDALAEVARAARQLLDRKLELEPDPVEAAPDAMSGAGSSAGGGSRPAAPVSAEPRTEQEAAAAIAAAARFLRRARATDPAAYLLTRGYRWGELRGRELDPRLLAAPPTDVRTRLKTLLLDAEWEALLESAEEVMAQPFGRGWLDLQRYVLTACDSLGGEFEAVGTSIRAALRALLRDVPQLADATLMDDSPTANAETRRWLQDHGLLGGEPEPEPAGVPLEARAPQNVRDPLERAMERVRAGQPNKAIQMLMGQIGQEKSPRARFIRRSQVAKIMVGAGMPEIALPILQEMVQEIETHQLEDWEAGETVALPLGLLYRCLEKLDGDSALRQDLYQRVCRLDPMQAIDFQNGEPESVPEPEPEPAPAVMRE